MSLKDVWVALTKRQDARVNHTFSDDDRKDAIEARRKRREIEQIRLEVEQLREEMKLERQKAELESLKEELYGSDDEEPNSINDMMPLLMLKLLNGGIPNGVADSSTTSGGTLPIGTPHSTPSSATPLLHYSDEDIRATLSALPKLHRKMLAASPPEAIRLKLREMYHADDDSIDRALEIIKA